MERNLSITVKQDGQERILKARRNRRLSDLLTEHGYAVAMPCGGMGTCGKCTVRIDGTKDVLACRYLLQTDCTVELEHAESGPSILSEDDDALHTPYTGDYGIAIDIGTTTIAAAAVELPAGRILRHATLPNSQRAFGADVISRIRAADNGHLLDLQDLIRKDLITLLLSVTKAKDKDQSFTGTAERIVIAANTTMLHLLRGYSCTGMARYPYMPLTLLTETLTLKEVLPNAAFLPPDTEVILMPGFTAFVGADILSGVYAMREEALHDESEGADTQTLLVDLGTNGEMALFLPRDTGAARTALCSTAAGPVFEGAGIRCGMGAVRGAITHVRICKGEEELPPGLRRRMRRSVTRGDLNVYLETIQDAAPKGICGSGVLETVAELRRTGLVDETGLLADPFFEEGFVLAEDDLTQPDAAQANEAAKRIVFTQQDIRAVQTAKAAIRAGIDTLLYRAGVSESDALQIRVAGGFSQHMDFRLIAPLQMFPPSRVSACSAAGNTALTGAVTLLSKLHAAKQEDAGDADKKDGARQAVLRGLEVLSEYADEIVLAQDDTFQERFLKAMAL